MPFSANIAPLPHTSKNLENKENQNNISNILSKNDKKSNSNKFYEDDFLDKYVLCSPDAVIVTDRKGVIRDFNRVSETIFGYLKEEILGHSLGEIFSGDNFTPNRSVFLSKNARFRWNKVTNESSVLGFRKNGERIPVEVLMTEYIVDRTPVRVYCIKDATSIFREKQRVADLEREIAHLSQHSLLGELATAITHELSQPLMAISNYAAAASHNLARSSSVSSDHSNELLSKAGEQAKKAWLIIHRLRQLIQHRAGEYRDEDLKGALDEAIQLATLGANQHSISIEIDVTSEAVTVHMDRVQVQVLIANLIRNAIDELRVWNGERRLWIRLTKTDDDYAEITVEDTGPGIAPDVFENIFDPFLTTKPDGLGVGLAVSRRIARAHGGRLLAYNKPQGGAAFSFVIPLSMSERVTDE